MIHIASLLTQAAKATSAATQSLGTDVQHFITTLISTLIGMLTSALATVSRDVSMLTLAYAALGAFGAFLVASNLGLLGRARIKLPSRGAGIGDDFERMSGQEGGQDSTLLSELPLLDRAFGPLINALVNALPKDDLVWVEETIDKLDRPSIYKSSANYYAARVLFALFGFLIGGMLGVSAISSGAVLTLLFALPAAGGVLGYLLPKQELKSRLVKRREAMLFEAPYMFDRLAVYVVSESNLPQGLIKLTSVAEGGYLMRELRQVADDYLKAFRFGEAVSRMAQRNEDVPIVVRFCERLVMAEESGSDLLEALNVIGARARTLVENRIRKNGAENQALLIVPTMLALMGVFVVIGVPMIGLIGKAF